MKIHIKKTVVGLLVLMLICLSFGCGKKVEEEKPMECEGMSILLGKQYQEAVLANATWYYTSPPK